MVFHLDAVEALQTSPDWTTVEGSLPLLAVIILAGLGTGILFIASLQAYRQRRSTKYLLITVAVGALLFRSVVGVGTVAGYTPMVVHHVVEHTFDFLIATLVLYAVYRSKPTELETHSSDVQADGGVRRREQ